MIDTFDYVDKTAGDIVKGLVQMGYRKLSDVAWGKPVAFHLFLFEIDKMRWTNFFKGKEDSMQIWNSETFKKEDWETDENSAFLSFLKYTEQTTRIDTTITDSKFEFMTNEEYYRSILG